VVADTLTSVRLVRIRFEAGAWPRQYADSERIEDFAALYREEGVASLPAPELFPDGQGGFLIGDGVHRLATRQVGLEAIPARVLEVPAGGSPSEVAYLHTLARSAVSSKPLTRAEKQAVIRRLASGNPAASDREIGRLVGVDHKTVGRIRRGDSPAEPTSAGWTPGPAPEVFAKRLFRSFEKAYEGRGLGIADFFVGDRTGEHLAAVLSDVYGEQALPKVRQFQGWLELASVVLEKEAN
jgi:hypothetical protein